eukprot:935134_1
MNNNQWSCSVCTLLNPFNTNICTVCGATRNQSSNINQDITSSQQMLLSSLPPKQSSPIPPDNNNTNTNNNNQEINDTKSDIIMDTNVTDNDTNDDFELENDTNDQFEDNENNAFENDENNVEFEEDNDGFNDDGDDWGDDDDLCYDEQKTIQHNEEEDCEEILKRALEKRRLAQSKLDSFWKCGKCQFLNHPSRAVCMMCAMPQLDVVHHIMMCPKNELKVCVRCKAYVVPHLYDDHVLDCKPIGALDNESTNQAWFVKLTVCEQNAINHVNGNAIKKSEDNKHKLKLIDIIAKIDNGKYQSEIPQTLSAMYHFLEWKVPIIIRIHIDQLIPKLLHDTHYRNLFQNGKLTQRMLMTQQENGLIEINSEVKNSLYR